MIFQGAIPIHFHFCSKGYSKCSAISLTKARTVTLQQSSNREPKGKSAHWHNTTKRNVRKLHMLTARTWSATENGQLWVWADQTCTSQFSKLKIAAMTRTKKPDHVYMDNRQLKRLLKTYIEMVYVWTITFIILTAILGRFPHIWLQLICSRKWPGPAIKFI